MSPKPNQPPAVSPIIAKQIDENLKRIYAPALTEEIPDQLQALLQRLRDKDRSP